MESVQYTTASCRSTVKSRVSRRPGAPPKLTRRHVGDLETPLYVFTPTSNNRQSSLGPRRSSPARHKGMKINEKRRSLGRVPLHNLLRARKSLVPTWLLSVFLWSWRLQRAYPKFPSDSMDSHITHVWAPVQERSFRTIALLKSNAPSWLSSHTSLSDEVGVH